MYQQRGKNNPENEVLAIDRKTIKRLEYMPEIGDKKHIAPDYISSGLIC